MYNRMVFYINMYKSLNITGTNGPYLVCRNLNENITYSPAIKDYVRMKWSDFWSLQTENKLHSVQPNLGICPKSCSKSP